MSKANKKFRRKNGKFVTKKFHGRLLKCECYRIAEALANSDDKNPALSENIHLPEERSEEPSFEIAGDRIVNLEYMKKKLFCSKCNQKLYIHNIEAETVYGLGSYFKVKCNDCSCLQSVPSGPLIKLPGKEQVIFEANLKLPIGNFLGFFILDLLIYFLIY